MEFLEKHLEDIIHEAFFAGKGKALKKRGLHFIESHMACYRQFKIEGFGVVDLLFVDVHRTVREGYTSYNVTAYVCELKKGEIDYNAIGQICRYMYAFNSIDSAITQYLHSKGFNDIASVWVVPVLIGSGISNSPDIKYVLDALSLSDLEIYTYGYGLEGMHFNRISADQELIDAEISLNDVARETDRFNIKRFALNKIRNKRQSFTRRPSPTSENDPF
jgi:hypothetical protein